MTVGKGGSGGKTLCLWLLGRDCLVWMTGWRLIWYSRGRPRLAALPLSTDHNPREDSGVGKEKGWESGGRGGRDFGPNCTEEEAVGVRGEGWGLMAMLP